MFLQKKKMDESCEKHVFYSDEKNALIDKIHFLDNQHDCGKKDKLIKLLKENESNNL